MESNWVHSTLRPLNGLLYQSRVIMMMEKLVEWLAGENEVLGENLPQCRFVHHKPPHAARTRNRAAAVGSQRLTAWTMARPNVNLWWYPIGLHVFTSENVALSIIILVRNQIQHAKA
jgi:hypothetical protein